MSQFSNLHYLPIPASACNGVRFRIKSAVPLVVVGAVADSGALVQPGFVLDNVAGLREGSGWHPWSQFLPTADVEPLSAGHWSLSFTMAGDVGSCLVILTNTGTLPVVEFLTAGR
jgi:hypothetical protein